MKFFAGPLMIIIGCLLGIVLIDVNFHLGLICVGIGFLGMPVTYLFSKPPKYMYDEADEELNKMIKDYLNSYRKES